MIEGEVAQKSFNLFLIFMSGIQEVIGVQQKILFSKVLFSMWNQNNKIWNQWISKMINGLNNSINQIENCAKTMKQYNSPKHSQKQKPLEYLTTIVKYQNLTPKISINPIIIQQQAFAGEGESESGGQQQGKFKIEQLCNFFMENIAIKENCDFEARQLIENTGVKQRRIYDLMNILEGCGFIKRTSKGKYTWFGFEHTAIQSQFLPYKNKDTTSLRNLAFKVKDLLFTNEGYIDIKDIFQKIQVGNSLNPQYNPKSIKRRVYECCKILKVMGVIDKKGHKFKWITSEQRKKIKEDLLKKEIIISQEQTGKKLEGFSDIVFKSDKQACLISLVRQIDSQQDLQSLIKDIRNEYKKQKNQNLLTQIHPKRLFK